MPHLSKGKIDKICIRDNSKFNTESYLHDINTIDWNVITEQCSDLHVVTARIIDAIELIVEKHAQKENCLGINKGSLKKAWLTRGIVKSIKFKHTMYKTHFLSNDPAKIAEFK